VCSLDLAFCADTSPDDSSSSPSCVLLTEEIILEFRPLSSRAAGPLNCNCEVSAVFPPDEAFLATALSFVLKVDISKRPFLLGNEVTYACRTSKISLARHLESTFANGSLSPETSSNFPERVRLVFHPSFWPCLYDRFQPLTLFFFCSFRLNG